MPASNVIRVLWVWRDALGGVARPYAHMPVSVGLASAADQAAALSVALNGASDCVVQGFSLIRSVVLSDALPVGGQSANWRAMLVFECGVPENDYYVLEIPGAAAGIIAENGVDIEIDGAIVLQIAAALINGNYTNPFGQQITALIAAYVRFEP